MSIRTFRNKVVRSRRGLAGLRADRIQNKETGRAHKSGWRGSLRRVLGLVPAKRSRGKVDLRRTESRRPSWVSRALQHFRSQKGDR